MAWIVGLGIAAFLFYQFPAFRVTVLIVGGLVVLGTLWLWYSTSQQTQIAKSLIPVDQLQITNLRLSNPYGSYELSGEVQNNSSHELTGITMDVKAYDCPGTTITSACTEVGEDKNVDVFIDAPSKQVREISDAIVDLSSMPPIQGNFLWTYGITGTTGM